MAKYLYDGPEKKVHAGGYSFKPGKPVEVNEGALTDKNRAQFKEHGIKPVAAAKPAPAPAVGADKK